MRVFKTKISPALGHPDGAKLKKLDPFFNENKICTSFFSLTSPATIEKNLESHLQLQEIEYQMDIEKYKIKIILEKNEIRFKIL